MWKARLPETKLTRPTRAGGCCGASAGTAATTIRIIRLVRRRGMMRTQKRPLSLSYNGPIAAGLRHGKAIINLPWAVGIGVALAAPQVDEAMHGAIGRMSREHGSSDTPADAGRRCPVPRASARGIEV